MREKVRGNTKELALREEHGEYGDEGQYLLFIFWNYYEKLIVIEPDIWFQFRYYKYNDLTVYCGVNCTRITEGLVFTFQRDYSR